MQPSNLKLLLVGCGRKNFEVLLIKNKTYVDKRRRTMSCNSKSILP